MRILASALGVAFILGGIGVLYERASASDNQPSPSIVAPAAPPTSVDLADQIVRAKAELYWLDSRLQSVEKEAHELRKQYLDLLAENASLRNRLGLAVVPQK